MFVKCPSISHSILLLKIDHPACVRAQPVINNWAVFDQCFRPPIGTAATAKAHVGTIQRKEHGHILWISEQPPPKLVSCSRPLPYVGITRAKLGSQAFVTWFHFRLIVELIQKYSVLGKYLIMLIFISRFVYIISNLVT